MTKKNDPKKCEHGRNPDRCYPCYAHRREQETDIPMADCQFNWYHQCSDTCPGKTI
jgi:hypothetical protein